MRLTKLLITPVVCAGLQLSQPAGAQSKNDHAEAGKTLNDFFEADWNYVMEQNPGRASSMGDRRWNDRWSDQSLEAIKKREEHATAALARLKKFDSGKTFRGGSAQLRPLQKRSRDRY
jgi:uncharacterized protein (DUF885 family)